jgi:hypothetical protein
MILRAPEETLYPLSVRLKYRVKHLQCFATYQLDEVRHFV